MAVWENIAGVTNMVMNTFHTARKFLFLLVLSLDDGTGTLKTNASDAGWSIIGHLHNKLSLGICASFIISNREYTNKNVWESFWGKLGLI